MSPGQIAFAVIGAVFAGIGAVWVVIQILNFFGGKARLHCELEFGQYFLPPQVMPLFRELQHKRWLELFLKPDSTDQNERGLPVDERRCDRLGRRIRTHQPSRELRRAALILDYAVGE